MVNSPMKPNAYSMGVANEMDPLYKVAVQLKDLDGRRDGHEVAQERKHQARVQRLPLTNKW